MCALEFDVIIVGAGFTGLSIASVFRKKEPSARIALISREGKPGGVWTQAASTVRLHQPTQTYALPTVAWDDGVQKDPLHSASGKQVLQYAQKLSDSLDVTHVAGLVGARGPGANLLHLHLHLHLHDVEELPGNARRVIYVPLGAELDACPQGLTCRHVVQATGFDFYSGEPRVLGLPLETHSSELLSAGDGIRGECCLVVGSGKSSIDVVRLLVKQGNTVRCVYRNPTAYLALNQDNWYAKYLKWLNPNFYFFPMLTPKACELYGLDAGFFTQSAEKPTFAQYTVEPTVKSFTFFLVGRGKVADWWKQTRGGIMRRSEYLLMNWMMRAHGVQADVASLGLTPDGFGKVVCAAFPGLVFDRVITCTGYKGSTTLLPHAVYALTPLMDLHLVSGWMLGHLVHSILDDPAAIASWNALARQKSEYPWFEHYAAPRAWAEKHRKEVVADAWDECGAGLAKNCDVPPMPSDNVQIATVMLDMTISSVCNRAANLVVWLTWEALPKWAARGALAVFGPFLARL